MIKKKHLGIVVLGLILSISVNASETYLSCSKDDSSVTLSYDNVKLSGKEHISGGDTTIDYDVQISDTEIIMQRYYEGKFVRSWNIDRYSGKTILYSTINADPSDKSIRSYDWFCKLGSKKF